MKVLYIGGTGIISAACARRAIEQGIDLHLMLRGKTQRRPVPQGATVIQADINNPDQAAKALEGQTFDSIVDWVAFTAADIQRDLDLFRDKTSQYIFISSAVVYQKPPVPYIVTEGHPIRNPDSDYALNKIAAENRLLKAYRDENFPAVIVRPSHTYDTNIPVPIGGRDYTILDRIQRGKPVIAHGDGSSLWTLTHSDDFAKGFVGLLCNPLAKGQAYHITSDEVLTWNQIYEIIGQALGVAPKIVHIPSDLIAQHDPAVGASLLGDKTHCAVFDNKKIKQIVPTYQATIPFHEGIRRTIVWFEEDKSRQAVSEEANRLIEDILEKYGKAFDVTP